MRVLTSRLALGALVLGSVCALADTAQAQPLRRLFGRGYGGGYTSYGNVYDGYGYNSGYGYNGNVVYGSNVVAANNCCCDGGGQVMQTGYYPSTNNGYGRFRSGYGASMYFPTQGYSYAQPMPYATGGVTQAGYPQGYLSGAVPAGGIVPGQLPTRPYDGTSGDTTATESKAVKITNDAFDPADLNVKVGATVKWTNDDKDPHTVTSDKGDWGSQELAQGQTFTATFTKAGTFEYHCKLHPSMKGKITVK
jgi:plastocyanin